MRSIKPIQEYDTNGNLIHYRHSNGYEYWREYDTNGRLIHYRNSDGVKEWREYDTKGKCIHYRSNNGFESWCEYDTNGNEIHYRSSSGFEYWYEYDTNGKLIHYRNSDGYEYWYDSKGNVIDKPTEKKDNGAMALNALQTIGFKWSQLPSVDWEGNTPIVRYTHDRKDLIIVGIISHEEEDDDMLSSHIPIIVEEWKDNLGEHLIIKPVTLNGVMVHDAWISRYSTLDKMEYPYVDFVGDIEKCEYNQSNPPVFVGASGLLYSLGDIFDYYNDKIEKLNDQIQYEKTKKNG